ncbi:MAG: polymer-forming cytoskeletal protein [Thermoanaerobaculaceae bacterium]
MSFGKDSSHDPGDLKPRAASTVVARDTVLTGELGGSKPVRIEGTAKGTIQVTAPIEVVEGAVVEGEIIGTTVRLAGTVNGNVTAKELAELLATAVVRGDVRAAALHVVEGAKLEGRVQMTSEPASPAPAKTR